MTVPLDVFRSAIHLALTANTDVMAADAAVRAFQDKYGSLWGDDRPQILLAAEKAQAEWEERFK